MRIAIFGSWRPNTGEFQHRGSESSFRNACISLGRELAKHEHRVIVASDDQSTADRWIVEGIIEEIDEIGKITTPMVEVVETGNRQLFRGEFTKKYPKLFTYYGKRQSYLENVCLNSIEDVDAMLTIGGGKNTYSAGVIGIVAKKKLVPVGSFGGASERLLDVLESERTDDENVNAIRTLRGDWTCYVLETAAKLMGSSSFPKILVIHGRADDWKALKEFLQTMLNLSEPIVMERVFGGGKTLPEKFEYLASKVDACIVVATPDDIGGLNSKRLRKRARQNVWLETGWFWGTLGRKRILILSKGILEWPSDLKGIEVYRYTNNPLEKSSQLRQFVKRLRNA